MTTIRPASIGDLQAIEAFDLFAGDRAREIAEGRMLVAETAGAVSGYVAWQPGGLVGRDLITCINVDERHRRRGLASALVRAVLGGLPPGRIFISTEADNEPMLTLLTRYGWHRAGAVAGANASGQAEVLFFEDVQPMRHPRQGSASHPMDQL